MSIYFTCKKVYKCIEIRIFLRSNREEDSERRIFGEGIKYVRDKYKIACGDFKMFFGIPSTTAYTMYKDYKFNLQNNFKQIASQSDI